MSHVLSVKSLSKSFDSNEIIKDINFSISKGETLGLFGKSGSGKTTVGKCITGLEKPSSGNIIFKGKDISDRKTISTILPKIQMIFQHPETSLNPRMKGFESIAEPLRIHSSMRKNELSEKIGELVELVGLHMEHLHRYPSQLSGGEIQRIVLARILSVKPELIVADEPTSMLDVSVQAQILRLMQKIQDETGVSYLFVSHDIEVLRHVCHRIAYLENGTIARIEKVN
ncbi:MULTISPECIES: ABC transporter ATP-binding protein [Methanosarcina]|uniref:Oligopeptide transport ATP-binding protein OppF n=2 Tax=Methanosarcina barkeri TaxID=2208 RepID=A0A0E3QZ89_METBA|nr:MULTISPECIES: dipeptide/oligopeptide/nickel ABC transporter ATP-binding protein [Methanosarcina]AKB56200.1 Oligopeptide transport ATP-binding protein OppF [Methanosarcina barkeri MS]AKB59678.1 Oligopeptide transport ATP-binding protein OppF [Methanosarcina barkeri 227]OED01765.1 peptide ABC transporter ATP-binding protein [Methanosarcina sp. A14]